MSLLIGFSGCEKKSGQAVVLAKEHIAAALPVADTLNAESAASPDEQPRAMADDEIAVDGYVTKPEARGTSRDPRALKFECSMMAAGFKSTPIELNGRNCGKMIG